MVQAWTEAGVWAWKKSWGTFACVPVHVCVYVYVLGKGKTLYTHWTVSLFIEINESTATQQFCCCAPSFHGSKQADCKGPCTRMFTAALFIILRNWKQPNCPSIRNWLTKWWSHATIKWCCGLFFWTELCTYIRWRNGRTYMQHLAVIPLTSFSVIWKPVKVGFTLFPCVWLSVLYYLITVLYLSLWKRTMACSCSLVSLNQQE